MTWGAITDIEQIALLNAQPVTAGLESPETESQTQSAQRPHVLYASVIRTKWFGDFLSGPPLRDREPSVSSPQAPQMRANVMMLLPSVL
jgi:hypothetical protein